LRRFAPGELEALHVAEEIAGELRPCGRLAGPHVVAGSRVLRLARSTGEAVPVQTSGARDAKFFGRHRSGIIHDGDVRNVSVID
jgi:hypothetical protein